MSKTKPPLMFWIVSVVLLLWALAGLGAFYAHVTLDPATQPDMTDYDRAYFAALPSWFSAVFALAVVPAVAGTIALLLRSRWARPLFAASLVGVILQFGYVFGATDLIAHKGVAATVPFPLVIFLIAVVQLWVSGLFLRRGWIG